MERGGSETRRWLPVSASKISMLSQAPPFCLGEAGEQQLLLAVQTSRGQWDGGGGMCVNPTPEAGMPWSAMDIRREPCCRSGASRTLCSPGSACLPASEHPPGRPHPPLQPPLCFICIHPHDRILASRLPLPGIASMTAQAPALKPSRIAGRCDRLFST